MRGLAVLFMIQLHTSHGWLLPEVRHGAPWDATQFFGGLAAPLFLFLAGAGVGLQWAAEARAGLHPARASTARALARGAALIVLGYVLRVQMWIIDGAAYGRTETYPAIALLLLGYGLALFTSYRIAHGRAYARWHVLAACALVLAGSAWAHVVDPLRAHGLHRVDVLQCIGASLMLLHALGARSSRRRPGLFVALAASVALITPWLQRALPGPLPSPVAAYFAQWPSEQGERVMALFPLCPWLGFAAIGLAIGLAWGRAQNAAELEAQLVRLMTFGAALALITNPNWAPLRWIAPGEPLAALTRLAYKAALCCVLIGPALALTRAPKAILAPLVLFGRSSLLIYWVHLEFAFGTASRPLARSLSFQAWALGTAVLIACMWVLATLRNTRHTMSIRAFRRRPVTG